MHNVAKNGQKYMANILMVMTLKSLCRRLQQQDEAILRQNANVDLLLIRVVHIRTVP